MEIAFRNIGNSKGVVLPKPFLAQVGQRRRPRCRPRAVNAKALTETLVRLQDLFAE
jgi:hypothetical protein